MHDHKQQSSVYISIIFPSLFFHLQKHYRIDGLRFKLRSMQENAYNPIKNGNKRSGFQDYKDQFDNYVPPYIRKYNRRFKSLYESMHSDDDGKGKNDSRKKKKYVYGQMYQNHNNIPENDILSELIQKSKYNKRKQHHKHRYQHHQKIKKLRSKPEAGIMQKKLKI